MDASVLIISTLPAVKCVVMRHFKWLEKDVEEHNLNSQDDDSQMVRRDGPEIKIDGNKMKRLQVSRILTWRCMKTEANSTSSLWFCHKSSYQFEFGLISYLMCDLNPIIMSLMELKTFMRHLKLMQSLWPQKSITNLAVNLQDIGLVSADKRCCQSVFGVWSHFNLKQWQRRKLENHAGSSTAEPDLLLKACPVPQIWRKVEDLMGWKSPLGALLSELPWNVDKHWIISSNPTAQHWEETAKLTQPGALMHSSNLLSTMLQSQTCTSRNCWMMTENN